VGATRGEEGDMSQRRNAGPSNPAGDSRIGHAISQFRRLAQGRRQAAAPRPSHVITVSRLLGSGGRRVAEAVAGSLGWPCYDNEILEALAQQSNAHHQAQMFEGLDEKTHGAIEEMLSSLLGHADQSAYFYLLPKAILTLAQTDCVILGRGAHLFLPDALKARVEASVETRVRNAVRFEGMTKEQAGDQIARTDRDRKRFLRRMMSLVPESQQWYRRRLLYDLVVNTDRCDVEGAAALVVAAAERRFGVSPSP
jgi:cytidylate kinase